MREAKTAAGIGNLDVGNDRGGDQDPGVPRLTVGPVYPSYSRGIRYPRLTLGLGYPVQKPGTRVPGAQIPGEYEVLPVPVTGINNTGTTREYLEKWQKGKTSSSHLPDFHVKSTGARVLV